VLDVVSKARSGFKGAFAGVQEAAIAKDKKDNGVLLHDAWMLSLHQAFTAAYQNDLRQITIFGKPLKSAPELSAVKIPYNRGEYSFDLAVIEMSIEDSPYYKKDGKPIPVPVVVRHLWQVESEMGNSAPELSEDLGKLTGGLASLKHLVRRGPSTYEPRPFPPRRRGFKVGSLVSSYVFPTGSTRSESRPAGILRRRYGCRCPRNARSAR
jgi:hypothetical protein